MHAHREDSATERRAASTAMTGGLIHFLRKLKNEMQPCGGHALHPQIRKAGAEGRRKGALADAGRSIARAGGGGRDLRY